MNHEAFNLEEYLAIAAGLSKHFKAATNFNSEKQKEYNELLAQFEKSIHQTDSKKGKLLEQLVTFIFENLAIFEVYENIHTSTNEIDQLVTLSDVGKILSKDGLFDIKGDYLLAECKNYNGRVDVTWVGKFCNLLDEQPARIGILFSQKGFTGKHGWDAAKGLTKKFYYRKEDINKKMYVIDFCLNDLKRLGNGESFIDILAEKVRSLETDTDLSKYLVKKHPAQK